MDCPPPMVYFDMDRAVEDGVTKSVGWEVTTTRQVHSKYEDNRTSYNKTLWLSGEVNMTNWRPKMSVVKYRHQIDIDPWLRPKVVHGSPVCFENGAVVGYWEARLLTAGSVTIDISWQVDLFDRADFNQDGVVDAADLGSFMVWFGTDNEWYDLDGDGEVGGYDLGLLFSRWT